MWAKSDWQQKPLRNSEEGQGQALNQDSRTISFSHGFQAAVSLKDEAQTWRAVRIWGRGEEQGWSGIRKPPNQSAASLKLLVSVSLLNQLTKDSQ